MGVRTGLRVLCSAMVLLCSDAMAHSYTLGALEIAHPWARASLPGVPTAAVYFVIANTVSESDVLLSASTDMAETAEFHEHVEKDGVLSMQQVPNVVIAGKSQVAFMPGNYHLMLMGLKQPLVAGKSFSLDLVFKKAGAITVDIVVDAVDVQPPSQ